MALSPADFAAYSRATGTPYPEDAEEKAALAPQVLQFRQEQLRAPQQESNLAGILGAAAVGLGALVGGVGLARALGRKSAQVAPSKIPEQNLAGVRELGTVAKQRAAEETVRQARTERPVGTVLTDLPQPKTSFDPWSGKTTITDPFGTGTLPYARTNLPISRTPGTFREFSRDVSGASVADRLAQDPELLSLVQQQAKEELSEARSFQSKAQAEYRNLISSIAQDIIDQERAAVRGPVVNQTIGALESGEDQMTGRMKTQLQRNEDLDMSQVEMLESIAEENNALMREQADPSQMSGYVSDDAINQAAAQLPDGLPFDQSEGLQILGRFPGPEGSSGSGVEFTTVESRYEGRPFRFTRLEAGSPTEGEGSPSPLLTEGASKYAAYGLSAPKTHVIPDDVAAMLQSTFKKQGNKLETYQRQALDLFETTGDSGYLTAAFGPAPAMAYQGRLPGGEVVQTKDLYIPIGERINPKTGEAVVDTRLEALSRAEGPEGIRSRVREQTMQQIERMTGVRPIIPSASQLASLPTVNKRAQQLAQRDIDEAQARYNQAQDFAVNYALSQEAKRGVYTGPQFETNPLTGKEIFVGMSPQVEQETIATPSLYQMRSSGGTSRTDLGGVGRRREALESEGFSSSSEDPLAFLYKDVDTGELVEPGNVSRQDVEIGKYVPVRGTAVEPQRILGSEGRTFKGISSAEIDPRSFDPATRQELAQQYPERVTPEGLIYAEKALERPSEARQYGRKFATQPPTTYGREAVNVSLELDRLRRSGVPGAVEAFLDKIMKERGVSAQGMSQPLRQKINPQGRFTT